MLNNKKTNDHLKTEEIAIINQKVNLEIAKIATRMAFLGGSANIISGIFFILIVYNWANPIILTSWYSILLLTNIANIILNQYYKDKLQYRKAFKRWRSLLLGLFALICLTWGSVTILFPAPNENYQLAILAFLLAVVIGFSFPSISDFKLAIISICCLLIPTIVLHLNYVFHFINNSAHNNTSISLGISACLLILGLFILSVAAISSRLIKQFFQLSFTNVSLSHKLEQLNRSLEKRVEERTIELQKSLQQVTYQASHDLLTNLPNQRSLVNFLKKLIEKARETKTLFAVVFFSLNELERIYNALGDQAGDTVLQTIASRFKELYEEPTSIDEIEHKKYLVTLSRKDVFVILMNNLIDFDNIEPQIEQLYDILEKPIYTEKQVIKLTASIGVSVYPHNGRDISSLLMNADAAMLLAKQSGGNTIKLYKAEINAAIIKQLELESGLHTALLKSEFILQYQPIIDLNTGKLVAIEALVRWENPTLGRITPDNFIPLAEANGIIIPLGDWVLRCASAQIRLLHQQGFRNLKVAINLSAKQLHYKFIIQSIKNILQEVQIEPGCIELELTETTAFKEEVISTLKELKETGFCISIDDFGTGYSGLHSLKLLPIDKIKIDKSFIQDVFTNKDSQAIVSNTIALGKKIKALVVAEGIETKEQVDFLIKNGCDLGQGYYFSPPIDSDTLLELLKSRHNFLIF